MTRSPNRLLAVIIGAAYVLLGFVGFAFAPGVGFAETQGALLLGVFGVNPLHNIVHVVVGSALVIAGLSSVRAARRVNGIVGALLLVLGLAGLYLIGTPFNLLALTVAANVVHLGSASVLLAVGLGAEQRVTAAA